MVKRKKRESLYTLRLKEDALLQSRGQCQCDSVTHEHSFPCGKPFKSRHYFYKSRMTNEVIVVCPSCHSWNLSLQRGIHR